MPLEERKCVICQQPFIPHHWKATCCGSPNCKRQRNIIRNRLWYAQPANKSRQIARALAWKRAHRQSKQPEPAKIELPHWVCAGCATKVPCLPGQKGPKQKTCEICLVLAQVVDPVRKEELRAVLLAQAQSP